MQPFNPYRVYMEFRDGVSTYRPLNGRKYTMTHSDDTAELFVTIGRTFAKDQIGPRRDEVLLGFEPWNDQFLLVGKVLISDETMTGNAEKRNEIFLREMPIALKAIRYADHKLFERFPRLDMVPILIQFQSLEDKYHRWYDFGKMRDYRTINE